MIYYKLVQLSIIFGAATAHVQKCNNYAEIHLKGLCPKINYIPDFNMSNILGWWYLVFSSKDNPQCLNNEGQTFYAALFDDKTINIEVCCRGAETPDVAVCGRNVGSGSVKLTCNPGELMFPFGNDVYPSYVLDSDYGNFTIVYGCKPGSQGRDEMIFVFSRGYQLNDTLVNRVRDVLKRNGISWSKAKPVKQGRTTPYLPGSKPCN